ncbi:MAG: hypothetical protein IJG34_09275 [Synergistaceae bacterium]|nr:hypothetical protein [Synergistaceae bacterium]MBQ3450069.1 hypothetical protein [Synergistaceae bacterium]MBQ3694055.1 hypothetical protein [Synergistaceae bacterium]MBQ6112447.1 hypothetical protein [Synergistaceae bacterium]MBQ9628911.1 hypothetical protein [Synergistaceae bacterium]
MYIMDTCAFIWYIETSKRLPAALRALIDTNVKVYMRLRKSAMRTRLQYFLLRLHISRG